MIVALDLDDTLYRELDYVESGFRAVATYLSDEYQIDPDRAFDTMMGSLNSRGRGHQFDDVLREFNLFSAGRLQRLLQVYRQHEPTITLPTESDQVLTALSEEGHLLFMVTDGNHRVQARKVTALNLWDRFEHCYLTYRYGRSASKPSTRVFELMLSRTGSDASQLAYVGDNPAKDFLGVRALGGSTIRVHTGTHADDIAQPGFDADHHIDRIGELPELIATRLATDVTSDVR